MNDIFNLDTPSLVPETDVLGIDQIEKENLGLGGASEGAPSDYPLAEAMALGLPEETTPYYIEEGQADLLLNGQNEGAANGHLLLGGSGVLEADSGGDLLTGHTEEIAEKEGEDLLTGGSLAIEKMVDEAQSTVGELLQEFAQKPEFEVEMELAFGNSYDKGKADVLKAGFSGEYLEVLRGIEIVDGDLINGANGAFAGETETIYLSREFVSENLGDVGAIAPVIVEEFGHYLDWEFNSFDAPGDEGEIFASFVLGEELSLPEFLGMKVEDDGAIGFLDGRMVSIENADRIETDTLDFFAGEIKDWGTGIFAEGFEKKIIDGTKEGNFDIPSESVSTLGGFLSFDREIKSQLDISVFANLDTFGNARFEYPVDLTVRLPKQVESGEEFNITIQDITKNSEAKFDYAATQGFEMPNAGIKAEFNFGTVKLNNITLDPPFVEPLNIEQGVDLNLGKAELSLDVKNFVSSEANRLLNTLNLGNVTVNQPKVQQGKFAPGQLGDSSNSKLPDVAAKATSNNFLNAQFDVDELLLNLIPAYRAANISTKLAGIDLKGLGVEIKIPNFAKEEAEVALGQQKVSEAEQKLRDAQQRLDLFSRVSLGDVNDPLVQQAVQEVQESSLELDNANDSLKLLEQIKETARAKTNAERVTMSATGDLIDIKANLGLAFQQDFIFDPDRVTVTMSVKDESGQVVESFDGSNQPVLNLTAPSEGSGIMEVEAKYELAGEVKNYISPALQGSIDYKIFELTAKGEAFGFSESVTLGPLLKDNLLNEAVASPELFSLVGSPKIKETDPDPLFKVLKALQTADIGGQEDATKDLIVEKTYYIPYGMPISISNASAEEGETLQFTVTLAEPSEEQVTVGYKSDKGEDTVTFAPGETTQIIEIPAGSVEATESFEVALINPNGISFPETLPNGESTITATGTIFDKPPTPDDNGPGGGEGSGYGDPHLVTFDGLYYDFQAAGEFIVAKSDAGDLEIQARQRPFVDRPLSVNTAVATKIGDQRIGFYADEDPVLRIDGQPIEIPDNQSIPVGEGQIFRDGRVYTVVYPTGEQLEVKTALTFRGVSYLNYNIFLNEDRESTISGILGNNNGNTDDDIILADGTVLEKPSRGELYGSYADSWRVTQESSLFDYEPGRNTDSFTINGFPTRDITVDDLDPADVARARELIGDRITDPALINATIIDLVFSDFDESFIEAAEGVARTPEASIIIDIEPEAVTDTATTVSNTPTTINVLANDISTPGLPVSLETFDRTSAAGGTITRDDSGTPDDATDDQLTYTPPTNFSGSDSFQYTINDGDRTATGLVTIIVPGLNLANLDGNNGFVLNGINPGNFSGVAVSQIGDFNGDSIDDLSIGAFAADPNGNNAAGESYVIFGTNNGFPANLDLTNLDGSNGLTLQGIDIQGLSGGAVGGAGDINNDGIDDLIIGAFGAPANGNNNAGKAYVVFGNSGLPANIDLANLNGSTGFVLSGLNEFDYAGVAVGGAGDINNDGIDDLYISAPGPLSAPPSKTYIVFGSETGYPANIDLSALNGSTGFVINDSRGLAGSDVSKAGDINNDGIADLIIGADEGSGDSYVVYGSSSFPATVELSSILNGTNGSLLSATDVLNPDGTTVRGVGDVNNDGISDLMVAVSGTTTVDNLPITKGYVIFGDRSLPFRFDLSALNGSNGFVINDFSIDNILGFSIGEVGDFNRDGIDDILIGTSQADANGNIDSGKSYVVFGKRDGNFPTNIDLARLDSRDGLVLNGVQTEDLTGSAVDGAGDLNNDGISDLIVGAPGSLFNDAPGKSYVVFGSNNFGSSTTLVFDEVYYLSQNPDVASLVARGEFQSGLQHFAIFGVSEERDFRVLSFNDSYYLTQNPGVASLVASGELPSGLDHFIRFGQFEGRSPGASEQNSIPLRFDENYYLNQNPDVREAVEAGSFSSGFDHYIQVGQFQRLLTSA